MLRSLQLELFREFPHRAYISQRISVYLLSLNILDFLVPGRKHSRLFKAFLFGRLSVSQLSVNKVSFLCGVMQRETLIGFNVAVEEAVRTMDQQKIFNCCDYRFNVSLICITLLWFSSDSPFYGKVMKLDCWIVRKQQCDHVVNKK